MSMFKVFDISGSGMMAQTMRLNITASNMANADTVAPSKEEAYKARNPIFKTMMDGNKPNEVSGGVAVAGVVEDDAPVFKEYLPSHPLSDKDGYIYRPNINLAEQMANMISASRSYQNNVEVLNTSKQMLQQTLRMGQG